MDTKSGDGGGAVDVDVVDDFLGDVVVVVVVVRLERASLVRAKSSSASCAICLSGTISIVDGAKAKLDSEVDGIS